MTAKKLNMKLKQKTVFNFILSYVNLIHLKVLII